MTAPQPTGLTVLDWNSVDGSPNLIGRLTVQFSNRLIVPDCPVFAGTAHGSALPSKPVIDRGGRQAVDANGKKRYAPTVRWPNDDVAARFSDTAIGPCSRNFQERSADAGSKSSHSMLNARRGRSAAGIRRLSSHTRSGSRLCRNRPKNQ